MSQPALRPMTADEFLEWDPDQPDARHERIDGVPVAMTGAQQRHDVILGNVDLQLRRRLRGGPCRVFSPDIAVRMPNRSVRRPDIGVHCGPFDPDSTYDAPRLIVEVLSPSTRSPGLARKLEEYKSIPSLQHILLVQQAAPAVIVWSRDAAGLWQHAVITGRDATIDLPAFGIVLPLAGLYEGIDFPQSR